MNWLQIFLQAIAALVGGAFGIGVVLVVHRLVFGEWLP